MRIKCGYCGQWVSVNTDWTVRKHPTAGLINTSASKTCEGSGEIISTELREKEEQRIIRAEEMRLKREEERKIYARKIKNARKTKAWKDARQKLIGEFCEQCGSTESLVIHHWDETSYNDIENYKNIKDENVITLCKRCHFALHKRMDLCPICKKNYKKHFYQTCYQCAFSTSPNKPMLPTEQS